MEHSDQTQGELLTHPAYSIALIDPNSIQGTSSLLVVCPTDLMRHEFRLSSRRHYDVVIKMFKF